MFLSFEGTSIKLYFVGRMECKSVFENTVFYIRELTFLKVLKILIDRWFVYFKTTTFAAVHFYVDIRTDCSVSSCHSPPMTN